MKTAYRQQARAKQARLIRPLLEREPEDASEFPDTVFEDDMPELAAWEWPATNQTKERQS